VACKKEADFFSYYFPADKREERKEKDPGDGQSRKEEEEEKRGLVVRCFLEEEIFFGIV